MTFIFNDPKNFYDELIEGFVAAYPSRVVRVPGGVARATATPEGQVAIVIGGGSGHYPAFAGLVGPGLAHGAAMGNVFASPSAQHVYDVAKAAEAGGGVLLTYGNYAGDCLNFDEAEARLNAEGVPCKTVTVTDDISSAEPADWAKRRGIAGDLCVFKAAGWAAEQGWSLDQVFEFATLANSRTRSFGVAFTGCTLPGADEPLFTVPKGLMGVGMGIHGEPGLSEQPIGTAVEMAKMLVDGLLAETPEGANEGRVAVMTNGLGSVSYEELFVIHGAIDALLRDAGITPVEPDVGEMCTSFDMAGVSLTLCWLDAELEKAWLGPANTPAYRKGSVAQAALRQGAGSQAGAAQSQTAAASAESQAGAKVVAKALQAIAARIDSTVDYLGQLDQIAGDGDHGIGMQRGATGAAQAAAALAGQPVGVGAMLIQAGNAWAEEAGGTSGALWGLLLRTLGGSLGDSQVPDAAGVAKAVEQASQAVMTVGKAQLGDKTMVDALVPFVESLKASQATGLGLVAAWQLAAEAATKAAEATADLVPKIGRARPHAEKSVGTPDPGAVSLASIAQAVGQALGEVD